MKKFIYNFLGLMLLISTCSTVPSIMHTLHTDDPDYSLAAPSSQVAIAIAIHN